MAHVLKRRRLVNPRRRRRRNMSRKQIRYFGSRRQKAALRNRGRRRRNQGGTISQVEHAAERAIDSIESAAEGAIGTLSHGIAHGLTNRGRRRRRNVGEILTVVPANPGRRRRRRNRGMAVRTRRRRANRRRRNRGRVRVHNRRRRNYTVRRRRRNYGRRRNRRSNPRVIVRYRNRRRRNSGRRRRNQGIGGFLSGDAGKVIGVLGGATVTRLITGFLPSSLTSGWVGYLTTGVVAVATGQIVGRATKNRQLGNWMTVGGLVIVGLDLIGQFFPQLQLGLTTGTSGMGLISSSNFFVPQVNMPGSMASFVAPAAIPAPVAVPASGMNGLGQGLRTIRRMGRMR